MIQTPYCMLQTQHLLLYYHLAKIENKDGSIPKEDLLSTQTVEELFMILEQITVEKYLLPSSNKFREFVKVFETFGKMLAQEDLNSNQLEPYHQTANYLSLINNVQDNLNEKFIKSVEELYESMKNSFQTHPKFKYFFEKLSELLELSSDMEIEANRYATIIRTILAATTVEAGVIKKDHLNKIIRPLLSTLKNETIPKLYQKMASKALVKLIQNDEMTVTAKEKIVK